MKKQGFKQTLEDLRNCVIVGTITLELVIGAAYILSPNTAIGRFYQKVFNTKYDSKAAERFYKEGHLYIK